MSLELMLLRHYEAGKHSVGGWLWAEKYDGVRAYWDQDQLTRRGGGFYRAPGWYTEPLRRLGCDADGELHSGRGQFNRASGIARRHSGKDWEDLQYAIFDMPDQPGGYGERIAAARRTVAELSCPWVSVVEIGVVRDARHVAELRHSVESSGGEGLVLRNPDGPYERKRTANALKVKSTRTTEAIVLSRAPGSGKHVGRLGALVCRCLETGAAFSVGTGFTDDMRERGAELYPVGCVITYGYFERFASGKPRHPAFIRRAAP